MVQTESFHLFVNIEDGDRGYGWHWVLAPKIPDTDTFGLVLKTDFVSPLIAKILKMKIKDIFKARLKQLTTYTFGKTFLQKGIFLGYFLYDRALSVERFATHSRHLPSQVPPSGLRTL